MPKAEHGMVPDNDNATARTIALACGGFIVSAAWNNCCFYLYHSYHKTHTMSPRLQAILILSYAMTLTLILIVIISFA